MGNLILMLPLLHSALLLKGHPSAVPYKSRSFLLVVTYILTQLPDTAPQSNAEYVPIAPVEHRPVGDVIDGVPAANEQ
ncbi:hypothetical protein C4D60_Mb07t00850 [Musa balbisiana]|uniref:Secreted protein n=1 Tax=Musa balbisiana TaxID=52838 RepID=A0A4S8JDV6_MUSBA|nr:hypothetical protein C4D60_Mb07t00850 [Musa balbisiana]